MPAGIGNDATIRILFGSFILGSAMGSLVTGMVLKMSMERCRAGHYTLSTGSRKNSEPIFKKWE